MFSEDFLRQFWAEFWGGVMATIFIALLTIIFAYIARLHIARFFRRTLKSVKHTLLVEEEKMKKDLASKE